MLLSQPDDLDRILDRFVRRAPLVARAEPVAGRDHRAELMHLSLERPQRPNL